MHANVLKRTGVKSKRGAALFASHGYCLFVHVNDVVTDKKTHWRQLSALRKIKWPFFIFFFIPFHKKKNTLNTLNFIKCLMKAPLVAALALRSGALILSPRTAHTTEVRHACASVTAVSHIIILPQSILKGPIWKTVKRGASIAAAKPGGSGVEQELSMPYLYCSMAVKQLIRPPVKRNRLCYWLQPLARGLLVPLQSCSNCKKGHNFLFFVFFFFFFSFACAESRVRYM